MSDTKQFWLGILDAAGTVIDLRAVPEAEHRDGVGQVALIEKPDIALGRYRFDRADNQFGYRFTPVTKVHAAEAPVADNPILPALARAVLDLHGRNTITGKNDIAALRAFVASVDAIADVDKEGL